MNITEAGRRALLIVDVQNDFCPGGALPVPGGNKVVGPTNVIIDYARKHGWLIIATRDWHPAKTKHFKDFGGIWPAHCVQNTKGAMFHPDLKMGNDIIIISKGMGDEDAYSPFDGRTEDGTSLEMLLRDVADIFICGLALDYCVKAAVLDALTLKRHKALEVALIKDATRAVNINPEDGKTALMNMVRVGVKLSVSWKFENFK